MANEKALNGAVTPDWRGLKLWKHQADAVETCLSYLENHPDEVSGLVNHPTGSGKTGIMAVLSALQAVSGPVLIVCPSSALVDQLIRELSSRFWQTIGAPDSWHPGRTERLYPSNLGAVLKLLNRGSQTPTVIVATVQALQQIHKDPSYRDLVGKFSVVIFDEGHREPAPSWAAAVRELRAPTLLFSATPYRNDYKLFHVSLEHIHFLSFQRAASEGIIRPVQILESDLSNNVSRFAAQIIDKRDEMIARGLIDKGDKVIIRAHTEQNVQDLFDAFCAQLSTRPEKVLAIHENFYLREERGNTLARDVPPNIRSRSERFLIHQFKLTEGIDDPACRVLALYDRYTTERQFIQQVGRLTRHPGQAGTVAPPAFVLGRTGDGARDIWDRFLAYDQACIDNGDKPPIRGAEVVTELLKAMPGFDYIGGKFRTKVDFDAPDLQTDLVVPLSSLIFEIAPGFDVIEFSGAIEDALETEDRTIVFGGNLEGREFAYRGSIRLNQTPFLSTSLYQTASLELTVFKRSGDKLFFYDSAGLYVDEYPEIVRRLPPRTLSSLLPNDGSPVSSLTLKNTDLSPLAIRGRSIRAQRLDQAGIFMGEQSHVATNASGKKSGARRALNLTGGRVRQAEGAYHSLAEFADWCDAVAEELSAAPEPAQLFKRFAQEIAPPPDTTPLNILIDLWDMKGEFVDEKNELVEFDFESVCVDIEPAVEGPAGYPFQFRLRLGARTVSVHLRFDAKKSKYWLKSHELSEIKDRNNERISLTRRLNQSQPFRIIVDPQHVYAYGKFYSVSLDLKRPDGPGATVLDMLIPLEGLESTTSEKGEPVVPAQTWPDGSLFRFIDDALLNQPYVFGNSFDAWVCDDLGTEAGDFIGYSASDENRACFIAAKWKPGEPGAGASPLYDIVAQTIKNLGYLKNDGDAIPGKPGKFDGSWTINNSSKGTVPRTRKGPASRTFRKVFAEVRARASTKRETWLVLGGGLLSKQKVEMNFRKKTPSAHTLQLFYLLLGLYSTCQSVGVQPKVFCAK